jgi:hypothetical protein
MRRTFGRNLSALFLAICIVLPASAAPRRDDGSPARWLERFLRVINITIVALDDVKATIPPG